MTQPSRTTESISRDNAAIRDIMHRVRELTVPDRATLAVGLVGHLATMMNHSQMARLLDELQDEATRVQDVPPLRQQEFDARTGETRPAAGDVHADRDARSTAGAAPRDRAATARSGGGRDVGQGGRGEFRARELL